MDDGDDVVLTLETNIIDDVVFVSLDLFVYVGNEVGWDIVLNMASRGTFRKLQWCMGDGLDFVQAYVINSTLSNIGDSKIALCASAWFP